MFQEDEITEEEIRNLHLLAREIALNLIEPDKKQLRFNDIVQTAIDFYNDPKLGIVELINACDKVAIDTTNKLNANPLYVHKFPMWEVLQNQYKWMKVK